MGSFDDFEPRMKKLERRLVDVWADIENLDNFIPAECKTCARAKHAYAAAYMVREQQRRIEELEDRLAKQDQLIHETYERGSRALRASIDELAKVGRRCG